MEFICCLLITHCLRKPQVLYVFQIRYRRIVCVYYRQHISNIFKANSFYFFVCNNSKIFANIAHFLLNSCQLFPHTFRCLCSTFSELIKYRTVESVFIFKIIDYLRMSALKLLKSAVWLFCLINFLQKIPEFTCYTQRSIVILKRIYLLLCSTAVNKSLLCIIIFHPIRLILNFILYKRIPRGYLFRYT